MKRTLFQTIIKESIREGGNAIPSAQSVRGDLAGEIAKDVINAVSSAFNCKAEPAGSTGKKGPEMTSGDIDILMDMPWQDENVAKVTEWVRQNFPTSELKPSPGFKEISFGYPYTEDGETKIAQVDLMFTGNINWRRWSAYSPSPYDEEYKEHGIEKAFKGLVQTVLLKAITSVKPLVISELPENIQRIAAQYGDFRSEEFQPGEAEAIYAKRMKREEKERMGNPDGEVKRPARKPSYKSWWYYMWDAEDGLVLAKKDFTGANGKGFLIDPKIQEKTPPITSNINEGLRLVMGPAATTDVLKNPITMVKYLFSGNYPYGSPENLRKIHNVVVNNDQIKGMPGAVESFEKVWDAYANKEQGEPAYSTSLSERLETLKLNINDVRRIAKSLVNEYRERKSYIKPEDAEFVERMNQFCEKYGYEPFTYSKKQGLDPEAYAKKILKRHNTFLRGVNTAAASDESIAFAKNILAQRGVLNPSMKQIAKIAATVPLKGRKANYVSTKSNADRYGAGNKNSKNFGGTAKVVRPYTLGPDRMKWFDEADFEVTAGDFYDADGYGNQQTANTAQAKPGEVIDTWGNEQQGNSELLLGGDVNFGGWVTDKERDQAKFGSEKEKRRNDKLWKEYKRIKDKKSSGLKLSKKEEEFMESLPFLYLNGDIDYDDFLTSRNNYHRK